MIKQSLSGPWHFRQQGSDVWKPGQVPGSVHTDLLALGCIPDPFVADHEKKVQWVAECGWEYRRSFQVDAALADEERHYLVCDGLDTLAEVRLNGAFLGRANNMFRSWRWYVSGQLLPDENELQILFGSPLEAIRIRQEQEPLHTHGVNPAGAHLRKTPSHWGWDWGPSLPVIGIWRDIRLEGCSIARLTDVHLRQQHHSGGVSLKVQTGVEAWSAADLQIMMRVSASNGEVFTASGPPGAEVAVEVENPQLWWPNGAGPQTLYKVQVNLIAGSKELESHSYQVGLRTIALRREPDAWGESFTFVVNGRPTFTKGANWIPADSFPARITEAQLEKLLGSAADANMNMLRVWGGGCYPEDYFYDLCDRLGLLVWQDFMFACAVYPAGAGFVENVQQEVVENIRRARHHACLALWCGNNEMEQGWVEWGWNQPQNSAVQRLKAGYDRMFHHLLPQLVAAEDPDRPYWPSSASSGIPFDEPNSSLRGDAHYWEVWHRRLPFTAYRTQYPRFMSEFGFQALPAFATIQAFAPLEEQNLTSYIMEHHQRSGSGNSLIISQMTAHFRLPKDFPSLVYLSQVLQAEGIRSGVEHWRRSMARVSGALYWQLNDCWPVVSWSSIDYFGRWKALHYAAKRFYAPLLLSVDDQAEHIAVHLSSDLPEVWEGKLCWRLETLAGQVQAKGETAARAEALADTLIVDLDFTSLVTDANRRAQVLVCELWQGDEQAAYTLTTFAPDKHLLLEDPGISVEIGLVGETLTINLTAASLARFVELRLDGADAVFSDNYFDLPAGMQRQVTAPLPAGWGLAQAQHALRVFSLINSYA
jgi:beta-mannosidase